MILIFFISFLSTSLFSWLWKWQSRYFRTEKNNGEYRKEVEKKRKYGHLDQKRQEYRLHGSSSGPDHCMWCQQWPDSSVLQEKVAARAWHQLPIIPYGFYIYTCNLHWCNRFYYYIKGLFGIEAVAAKSQMHFPKKREKGWGRE